MIKSYRTFFLGLFILALPFLGFPSSWKTFFLVISGLYIIAGTIKITLPRRGAIKKLRKKEKITPVFMENAPIEHGNPIPESEITQPIEKKEDHI
ncbi:MAG: hypothetical protein QG589_408 [Patescibacteria group bacterium]|jgi:hypothetical protein|nr:hypothetical protein [Patescibacteria group bacterium]